MSPCGPVMIPSAALCKTAFASAVAFSLGEGLFPGIRQGQKELLRLPSPSGPEKAQTSGSQQAAEPCRVTCSRSPVKRGNRSSEGTHPSSETSEHDGGTKLPDVSGLVSVESAVNLAENLSSSDITGVGWAARADTWAGKPLARSNLLLTLRSARRGCVLPPPADPSRLFSFVTASCSGTEALRKEEYQGEEETANQDCRVNGSGQEGDDEADERQVSEGKRNRSLHEYGRPTHLGALIYSEDKLVERGRRNSDAAVHRSGRVEGTEETESDEGKEVPPSQPQSRLLAFRPASSTAAKSSSKSHPALGSSLHPGGERLYMEGLGSRGVRSGRSGGGFARPRASYGGVYAAGIDRFFRQRLQEDDAFSTSFRARGHVGCVNAIRQVVHFFFVLGHTGRKHP